MTYDNRFWDRDTCAMLCCGSLLMFVMGVPMFFASCNFNVTTFCPRYKLFTGTVYMIKIRGIEYTEDNPPTFYRRLTHLRYENDTTYITDNSYENNTTYITDNSYENNTTYITDNSENTYKTYQRYDSYTTIYYAKHDDSYTCRVISDKILSSSIDIGKNVTWYSFKSDPTTCDPETMVVRRWYFGLAFVLFVASYLVCLLCMFLDNCLYRKIGKLIGKIRITILPLHCAQPDDNQTSHHVNEAYNM